MSHKQFSNQISLPGGTMVNSKKYFPCLQHHSKQ